MCLCSVARAVDRIGLRLGLRLGLQLDLQLDLPLDVLPGLQHGLLPEPRSGRHRPKAHQTVITPPSLKDPGLLTTRASCPLHAARLM